MKNSGNSCKTRQLLVNLGRRIAQILTPWDGEIRRSPGLNETPVSCFILGTNHIPYYTKLSVNIN